jgi:transcriptional repressor NrdR
VRCPFCGHIEDKVVDSRTSEEGRAIRRRRECLSCGRRYTSYERIEDFPVLVEKRNGQTEPFDKEKLASGIRKACVNRPVTTEAIDQLADDVVESLLSGGGNVVTTADLGKEILERLRSLDEVAYLRFASVYKDFKELNDFERELGLLQKKSPPKQPIEVPNA